MSMITQDFARAFADEWIEAWNSHDLPRILSHYAEDFRFSSPFIVAVVGEPSGFLRGRDAVGAYWRKALARLPDLQFKLLTLYVGMTSIVIHYSRHDGRTAAEYFEFDEHGRVSRSSAHYTEPPR